MSSWGEVLLGIAAAPERASEPEGRRRGFFSRLRENLGRSSRALAQGLNELAFDPNDEGVWERLEELLIAADVGVPATVEIVEALEAESAAGRLHTPDELREALQKIIADRLAEPLERRALDLRADPAVILVVGVNGTGKTTTIGKLAYQLHEAGASVVIGAADTFRAAAAEQLETWAGRAQADFVGSASGSDPAAVAFDAVSAGVARGRRVVIVDTAGLQQARLFTQAADVTGLVLTKLDGSAKGGIAIAIAHEMGIPIKLIGMGEGLEDLRPFDAEAFARALFTE
jgi:fused signal recognition particle receptor